MMKTYKILGTICILIFSTYVFSQEKYPFQNPNLATSERVKDLLGRLTIEEKTSLLLYNSKEIPRLNIPAYNWWNECLHGVARNGKATVFPQAIALAATWDTALIYRTASAISDEARAKYNTAFRNGTVGQYSGLTFWTPNINIFRDPRWGRGQETYGEDPFLTSKIGVAFVKGLQGNDPKYLKAAACAKHFAVHSGPEPLRHKFDAIVDEKDLRETYLPAFKALVDAKVEAIMCAYNRVNGEPCCGSPTLLTQILRNEWGFKGHVVTDCWALDDIYSRHKIVATEAEAAAMALHANVNVECGTSFRLIPEALSKGMVTEKEIDDALRILLESRFKIGLLDPQELVPWSNITEETINSQKNKDLARAVSAKSIVLLKNSNNTLPLKKDLKNIYVTGPLAANIDVLLGNYNGISGDLVSVLEGIMNKVNNNTTVHYGLGTDLVKPVFSGTYQAESNDATIAVIGLSPLFEGEEGDAMFSDNNGDRLNITLPANQIEFIKKLRGNHKKPLIVVIFGGSPISFPEVETLADAVLFAWYPGEQGGNAVADIIFGDVVPSGRLPLTFYNSIEDLPSFEDYSMKDRTYRYFSKTPFHPFGFGLSYTTFEYLNLKIDKQKQKSGDRINVSFTLKNTGKYEAEEVAQLYVSKVKRSERDAIKSLESFARIILAPGEEKTISMSINSNDLKTWNLTKKSWELVPGNYSIMIGSSSEDIKLTKEIVF